MQTLLKLGFNMEIVIIPVVALVASALTFFSGFGLGTILMPVFVLFFPIETAIALTAVVHLLNNILKVSLLYRKADYGVVLKFGIPAFICAFLGAKLLLGLEGLEPLHSYELFGRAMEITAIKLVIAFLIGIFVFLELHPVLSKIKISHKLLPIGGAASGFFGGLSGHQGALRSMFLVKCGLDKNAFIATGAIVSCMVDISRISVYWYRLMSSDYQNYYPLMIAAVLSAFAGIFIGRQILKKITMKTVRVIVSVMLILIAVLLAAGMI